MAKLIAEKGLLRGLVLSLEHGDHWVIGRDPDACHLLVEDPSASRKHLACHRTKEGFLLENLSTTNPALINQETFTKPQLLHEGDLVQIGDGTFRFTSQEAKPQEDTNSTEHESAEINSLPHPEEEATEEPPSEDVAEQEAHEAEALEPAKEKEEAHEAEVEEPTKEKEEEMEQEPMPETLETTEETTREAAPEIAEEGFPEHLTEEDQEDSIFDDVASEEKDILAEINFDLTDSGRWLIKVISGPNNGAEFTLQPSKTYVLGSDPASADIVFHDTSVSRAHARITVTEGDELFLEDVGSKNGTMLDSQPVEEKTPLEPNNLVTMGTTSFVIFDREGEMRTIISPLLPSIVKHLQREVEAPEERLTEEELKKKQEEEEKAAALTAAKQAEQNQTKMGGFLAIGILVGILVILGMGTATLFRSKPVEVKESVDTMAKLQNVMSNYPNVRYSFNKASGTLLLVGHVQTANDRTQLLYSLQGLDFIKNIDDTGIVIDEYVWQEANAVLAKNNWRGITVHSPAAGKFVMTGYLETRDQAERLSDYITQNFPYLDLLEQKVIVVEDVVESVKTQLRNQGMPNVDVKMVDGELSFTGTLPQTKLAEFDVLKQSFAKIPGVRTVKSYITESKRDESMVNLSDKYRVSGVSRAGGANISVVINGKILSRGDMLDGMTITAIRNNAVYLEKDGVKYRIDFSQ